MMQSVKLTKDGKRFWKCLTNKTKVFVEETDKPQTLYGGYWDEGSKNDWFLVTKTGKTTPLATPGCPGYDPRPVPVMTIPDDCAIVQGGIDRGNPSTLFIKVKNLKEWTF